MTSEYLFAHSGRLLAATLRLALLTPIDAAYTQASSGPPLSNIICINTGSLSPMRWAISTTALMLWASAPVNFFTTAALMSGSGIAGRIDLNTLQSTSPMALMTCSLDSACGQSFTYLTMVSASVILGSNNGLASLHLLAYCPQNLGSLAMAPHVMGLNCWSTWSVYLSAISADLQAPRLVTSSGFPSTPLAYS